jgi:hypothetical protein
MENRSVIALGDLYKAVHGDNPKLELLRRALENPSNEIRKMMYELREMKYEIAAVLLGYEAILYKEGYEDTFCLRATADTGEEEAFAELVWLLRMEEEVILLGHQEAYTNEHRIRGWARVFNYESQGDDPDESEETAASMIRGISEKRNISHAEVDRIFRDEMRTGKKSEPERTCFSEEEIMVFFPGDFGFCDI